jgi:hypothetical protein
MKNDLYGKLMLPAINGVTHARGHEKRAINMAQPHLSWSDA